MSLPLISVVVPLFNEEENIQHLFDRCSKALDVWTNNYEIICVNDGSKDKTLLLLKEIHQKDKRWKIISLSRNFGHQQAFLCGLFHAKGNYVAMIDGDLQDPPELLYDFYQKMISGNFDVVYGVRQKRKEGFFKKFLYKSYYKILKKMASVEIPLDSGDFCLMKKVVVDNMLRMKEQSLFLRGIRSWVGFRQFGYEYERDARFGGEPKYTFKKLFQLAYNGIFSFSQLPVKILTTLGFWVVIIAVLYSFYALYVKITTPDVPQGFTTLAIAIFLFGGIQLLALGIIGEYVLRIYDETRNRPAFIEEEVIE
jgi:polyisoprenyl-phosphate glycosyltransferase